MAVTLGAVGEGMVAGDAVNTAAQIQAAASPGEVWVDEVTRSMTAAAVRYRDAGEHLLKGKAAPAHLWAAVDVVAPVGGGTRIDGLEAPWTGRDHELRLVKDLFHAAIEDERPRLVLVSGVAGIGKTRLGWEFDKYVDGLLDVVAWHRARVLSYGDGLTFWPIAEMVRVRLGIDDDMDDGEAVARLDEGLRTLVERADERDWLRPRIAVLLGLDVGAAGPFPRSELFAAWTVFFDHVARSRNGAVLLLDDLEHAEPGLLDFLDHLLDASSTGLVVVACTRPTLLDRRPGWGTTPRATVLHLEPLSDAAMRKLVDGLVEGLTDDYREALVARAAGIPLYAMELVRALIDRDLVVPRDGRYVVADDAALVLDDVEAPPTLVALIAARLDALTANERRLVHDASVIGESFDRAHLLLLTDVPDPLQVLDELVRKQVLTLQVDRFLERGRQYRFVQGLVRTVAYDTLARRDRKARHLAVARLLLEQGDEVAAIAARHHLDAIDAVPDDPDGPS